MFGQLQETQCLYGVSAGPRPGTSAAQGMARAYASATGRKFSASALQGTKLWKGRSGIWGESECVRGDVRGVEGGGRGERESDGRRAAGPLLGFHHAAVRCWAARELLYSAHLGPGGNSSAGVRRWSRSPVLISASSPALCVHTPAHHCCGGANAETAALWRGRGVGSGRHSHLAHL